MAANHEKFTEECIMCTDKHVCHNEPKSKRQEWKHTVKKKFWVQRSIKKVKFTIFQDMKRFIIIDFPEKDATVNNVFFEKTKLTSHLFLFTFSE